MRRDLQREFSSAARTLAEDGKVETQVILRNQGDKEIIQPCFSQPGLIFVDGSELPLVETGEECEEAFHYAVMHSDPCMPNI